MADPFSIAGTAAGLISLGIQVCGGIHSYLDALHAREADIRNARQQIQELRNLLDIIKDQTDSLAKSHATASRLVVSSAETCKDQINALDKFVAKLTNTDTASTGTGLRQRVYSKGQRMMYPFHKPNIEALESRLDKLNASLQVALQVLDLTVTSGMEKKVTEIHSVICAANGSGMQISVAQRAPGPSMATPTLQTNPGHSHRLQDTPAIAPSYSRAVEQALTSSRCSCVAKRNWSLGVKRWGYWSVYHEESSSEPHMPGCKYAQAGTRRKTTKFGIQYDGLVRIMDTAFRLSLFTMCENEGTHIGPVLTYFPSVDETVAPVFKILDMAYWALDSLNLDESPDVAVGVVELCITEVLSLFATKRASPRATDSKGRTAMHVLEEILYYAQMTAHRGSDADNSLTTWFEAVCQRAVGDFIRSGVPPMRHALDGQSPASSVLQWWQSHPSSLARENVARMLVSSDRDSSSISLRDVPGSIEENPLNSWKIFKAVPEFAEACGCGPLSLAICLGDIATVIQLVAKSQTNVYETNIMKQTPLHLATYNHQILEVLISLGKALPLAAGDVRGQKALAYAIGNRDAHCVRMLVEAGSPITVLDVYRSKDEAIAELIVRGLKARRDELKALGIQNLLETEAQELGLFDENTLDYHSPATQQRLESLGVEIPAKIRICSPEEHVSVWSRADNMEIKTLESLWDNGFRDIDKLDAIGQSPILSVWPCNSDRPFLHTIDWLIQHGANLSGPVARNGWEKTSNSLIPCLTVAHVVAARIGNCWAQHHFHCREPSEAVARSITNRCLKLRHADKYHCFCSPNGSIPLTTLLKSLCFHEDEDRELRSVEEISRAMGSFLKTIQPEFTQDDHQQAIRVATFQAVGARHTCRSYEEYRWGSDEDDENFEEEIDEINSEQSELLDTIEDLVENLWDLYCKELEVAGFVDPEHFWGSTWLPVVEDACETLENRELTEDEIRDIKEAGVDWRGEWESDSASEAEFNFDDFREQIKEIARRG